MAHEQETRLKPGHTLEGFSLTGADDKTYAVTADTRWVLFAYSDNDGHRLNTFFESRPDLLQSDRVRYVADISGAPMLVRSLFILPSLEDLPFPVMVIKDDAFAARYRSPVLGAGIVLVKLKSYEIIEVSAPDPDHLHRLTKQLDSP